MKKRILSLLFTVCMLISMIPATVFAAEEQRTVTFSKVNENNAYGTVKYCLGDSGSFIAVQNGSSIQVPDGVTEITVHAAPSNEKFFVREDNSGVFTQCH